MAIIQYSLRATFREMLCRFVGLDPGHFLMSRSLHKSNKRLRKAEEKLSKEGQKRRKISKLKKFTKVEKLYQMKDHLTKRVILNKIYLRIASS